MFLLIPSTIKVGSCEKCKEPDSLDEIKKNLYREIYEYYNQAAQYYQVPGLLGNNSNHLLRPAPKHKRHRVLKQRATKQSRIYGEPSCNGLRNINRIDTNDDINSTNLDKLATCPWHVILEVDQHRIPQSIAKAVCTCEKCYKTDGWEEQKGSCQEVLTYVPVIRKHCDNGAFEYFADVEPVPVGCTCKQNIKQPTSSSDR